MCGHDAEGRPRCRHVVRRQALVKLKVRELLVFCEAVREEDLRENNIGYFANTVAIDRHGMVVVCGNRCLRCAKVGREDARDWLLLLLLLRRLRGARYAPELRSRARRSAANDGA